MSPNLSAVALVRLKKECPHKTFNIFAMKKKKKLTEACIYKQKLNKVRLHAYTSILYSKSWNVVLIKGNRKS